MANGSFKNDLPYYLMKTAIHQEGKIDIETQGRKRLTRQGVGTDF